MSYSPNSIVTGLLGFKLKKEFLGDGLFYRESEIYNYEVYATPNTNSLIPYTEIEANIKSAFASRSGDITVKVLDTPADFQFPNDHIRLGKFNIEVELRKPLVNPSTYSPELLGNYYKGLDSNFFLTYGTYFNDFKEDFGFEQGENGHDVYSHSISFSLQSGNKTTASTIAQSIFLNDKDTTFGINSYIGGVTVANSGNYQNYYSETYDLIKNSYSFTKKRELLPLTDTSYTYDLSHFAIFKDDGIIDVSEKGTIEGNLTFANAQNGYGILFPNAFSRCTDIFNNYKNFIAADTITTSLINLPITNNRTFNKPLFYIEYEVGYTSNPNISGVNPVLIEETIELDRNEDKFIGIIHSYNFNSISSPIQTGIDVLHIQKILDANTLSPAKISGVYQASSVYNSLRPAIRQIKKDISAGTKRKNLSISFEYTNNPIYFATLDGVEYAILDYKIADTKPIDIVNEYKIINRPTKTSVINYAYQTEKGSKNVSMTAKLKRQVAINNLTNPRNNLSTNLLSLYKYAVSKALENLKGLSSISLNYFLSDVRYRINSDDEITLDVVITYTIKKYKP